MDKMYQTQRFSCDVLVIGGSTAGCFAAITAKQMGMDVLVADKAMSGKSGASIMASGFWAVFNPAWGMDYDSTYEWINNNSSNLNNRRWTELFLKESWGTYLDLKAWGVKFPVPEEEMAGFFRKSIVGNDEAGHHDDDPHMHYGIVPLRHRAVTPALRDYAEKIGVRFMDRVMITDLIKKDERVMGAVGFPMDEEACYVISARATVISAGRNYFKSPGMNISGQTGDADAMAYRAGAMISGKEFPDMHMNIAKDPMWKGNGEMYPAYFQFDDGLGRRIPNRGFDLSLASTVHAGYGPVVWDFDKATENDRRSMKEYLKKRGNPREIERVGLDPDKGGKYPMIGGAAAGGCQEQTAGLWPVDDDCASNVEGLYSAGDSCCTWMWGAIVQGPPPGLSPAAITGKRAGAGAARYAASSGGSGSGDSGSGDSGSGAAILGGIVSDAPDLSGSDMMPAVEHCLSYAERKSGFKPGWIIQLIQNYMMPYYILHIKKADRLSATLDLLSFLREHMIPKMYANGTHELRLAHEAENMALNAEMILRSSLFRTESRGWHFREDYPTQRDGEWLAWTIMQQGADGKMSVKKEPIPDEWQPKTPAVYEPDWLAWEHPHE